MDVDKLTDQEVLELRDEEWKESELDDEITKFIVNRMRKLTADEYRELLRNRQANG